MSKPMPDWSGLADAYSKSFAMLCAGTVDLLITDTKGFEHLDVGCGTGILAQKASRAGHQVTAIDSDPDMVRITRNVCRDENVKVRQDALPHLDFPDNSFDSVTANFVINHVSQPREAVRELARVVRTGGFVGTTIWTNQPSAQSELFAQSMKAAGAAEVPGSRLAPEDDFERSTAGLGDLMSSAGLTPIIQREVTWNWSVSWEALWLAVAHGIAAVGRTYLAQTQEVQLRIEDEMRKRATLLEVNGMITFPSRAAYVVSRKF